MKQKFEVTLKRTYFHTITVEVDDAECEDTWKEARKIANNTSWQIEDAESSEDGIESIDIAE